MDSCLTAALVALVLLCAAIVLWRFWFVTRENFSHDNEQIYIDRLNDIAGAVYPDRAFQIYPGSRSYTVNKEHIYICLRDKDAFYDFDTLLYVTLHEMAHAISKVYSPDHTDPEFIANFNMLLRRARKLGLLRSHVHIPKDYCGR